jgi:alpha-glucosidase
MRTEVFDKYTTFDGQPLVTFGELSMCPTAESILAYISAARHELDMVFQADLVCLGHRKGSGNKYDFQPWKLSTFKWLVARTQTFIEGIDAWMTAFCENHDSGRSISGWASDTPEWHEKSTKMFALLLIVQTGTLFLYQGQEIGIINAPREWGIEQYKDFEAINMYAEAMKLDENGVDPGGKERIMNGLRIMGRDNPRFPT